MESNPSLMEESALIFETSENIEIVESFDELGLKEDLLRGKKCL
jgi:hypothetical protein